MKHPLQSKFAVTIRANFGKWSVVHEENIAKINHEINPALKTIYYRAQDDVISSSLVREFISFGKDVEDYVPERVLKIIENN